MDEITVTVGQDRAGIRLDRFLVDALNGKFSRSFLRKMIDGNNVLVDGLRRSAHYNVSPGEEIRVNIPPPKELALKAENIPLDIVYEDSDLLVLNKSAGISVHPVGSNLTGTLVNALLHHCKDLSGVGGSFRPGIVHRLDKDTSGLLVVSKNDQTHINLSGQFKNRTIRRRYVALARGVVQLDNGRIELPIARRKKEITKMGVSFADEKRKQAVTKYRVLKRFRDFTMLEITLETGRTHQIRVHLSHIGHPVVGDRLYGSQKGMSRQALHAKTLGFFHPATKKFMEFDSTIPEDMQNLINKGRL
jgi:23S rRNA pseudouridine1911/1915/1917 synthase